MNDIDIAIELVCKITDSETYQDLANNRVELAYQKGRTFRNSIDQILWPQMEVRKYLKAGSRVLSLHNTNELLALGGRIESDL